MRRIVWWTRTPELDTEELYGAWENAGGVDRYRRVSPTGRVFPYSRQALRLREAARTQAETTLATKTASRKGVLTEINSKAQLYAAILAGVIALSGLALFGLIQLGLPAGAGVICLGLSIALCLVAMGILGWAVTAGNKKMLTEPPKYVEVSFLRKSRLDVYKDGVEGCDEMIYVIYRRRRLFIVVALITVLASLVVFAGLLLEATRYSL